MASPYDEAAAVIAAAADLAAAEAAVVTAKSDLATAWNALLPYLAAGPLTAEVSSSEYVFTDGGASGVPSVAEATRAAAI
jgi:hypothetical protein